MDRNEKITRGATAKSILEHPVLKAALNEIEREMFVSWKESAPAATDQRETVYLMGWAVDQLRSKLDNWSAIGELEKRLEEQANE